MTRKFDPRAALRQVFRAAVFTAAMVFVCIGTARRATAQDRITVTNLDDSGPGSLRDAIEQSARNPLNPVTIDFAAELRGTIPLESTLNLCDAQDVSIEGPGAGRIALSGQKKVGIFRACNLRGGEPGADIKVTISGLTIENGSGQWGGGISTSARMTVRDSTFLGNKASDEGGAIADYAGTLHVINCTFSGNTAGRQGGALYKNSGTVAIANSTFSGNMAPQGGAIYNFSYRFTVVNSTIAGNTASEGGGGILYLPSKFPSNRHTAEVKGNILAENAGGNCLTEDFRVGRLTSQGYNLSTDDTCPFRNSGDRNGIPADLDPNGLGAHGGSTPTIAPLPTSPAVDAIPVDQCTDLNGDPLIWDQRGAFRPSGSGCEMGAFELSSTLPFAWFRASVTQIRNPPYQYQFEAVFRPGIGSAPIDPVYQLVTLTVGDYTVTFEPGSFRLVQEGSERLYLYNGSRPRGTVRITPRSGDRYKITGSLPGYPNPECGRACEGPTNSRDLPAAGAYHIVLTIGDSSGTAFAGHYERP